MIVRFAHQDEIKEWDSHILANPDAGNVFQGYMFAEQKKLGGWTPRFLRTGDIAVTVLEKKVPLLGRFWYMPKGPGITSFLQLSDMLSDIKKFAREQNVFVIKIEPELLKEKETLADFVKHKLVRARPIQPNASTILLDISSDLDTIMNNLNQTGRHAIKRAIRDGVTVKQVDTTDENCQIMYTLLAATAKGSFSIRPYVYYEQFWKRFAQVKQGQLFFAYVKGSVVAGAYAITFGTKSTYKDGASIRKRTVYGASHLLQWNVIKWAKERGALNHDFCGAPPSEEINNPDHPHYGIGRFKTSFNKKVVDYIGAYDIVVHPTRYKLWSRYGERIVTRLHSYLHHENYY